MKWSNGANSIFSGETARLKSESCVGLLNFMVAFRTFLAPSRTGATSGFALRIVKSFAVLSVRERSSGNSEAKIPHNRRLTSVIRSILTNMIRGRILR